MEVNHYRAAQDMTVTDSTWTFSPAYNAVLQVTIELIGGKRNVV